MTSIRDLVSGSLGIGERYCLEVSRADDGTLIAAHPSDRSPMDVVVFEGLERLDSPTERPPEGPLVVEVEILGRVVDGRLAGRVISSSCASPENVD
ncbi:hypothetical protein [Natronosalvus rutilus]|uniref:Uncharacterized protein n=1 Tax=Natronosalvus rutilus TaxID=2953753 RepID=A0A9E7SUA4_9EURY|nr:hypothetical protein [Natronosalvus rutilus]UTF52647.1 hypothetical protein NGM29_12745 [Natronosalvus rutilus]